MTLLRTALAAALVLGATTTVAVSTADARPHVRSSRVCNVTFRHGHRVRVCRVVRRGY